MPGKSTIHEAQIRLKRGDVLYVHPTSATHRAPFWTGRYDDDIVEWFGSLFEENWVVMDIGANIGYYTVPFAKRLKDLNGQVLSFEPVKANFKTLLANVEANRVTDIVNPFQLALGNENGLIEMRVTEPGRTSNAYIAKADISSLQSFSTEMAVVKKLDDFMREHSLYRCDFIKVDIEGAEIFLFQGATNFIERFKPLVFGEFNTFFLPRFGFTFLDIWNLFAGHGYECYEQIGNSSQFRQITPTKESYNVLLVPPRFNKDRIKLARTTKKT